MSNNPAMSVGQEVDAESALSNGYLACESYATLFHDFEKAAFRGAAGKATNICPTG